DSIMAARLMTLPDGSQQIIVARDISTDDGGLAVYTADPKTCLVTQTAEWFPYGGDMHEMGMWTDPNNPLRILIVSSAEGGAGHPDPNRDGKLTPDIRVHAVTDE